MCADPGVCVPVNADPPADMIKFMVRYAEGEVNFFIHSPVFIRAHFTCAGQGVHEVYYPTDGRPREQPQGIFVIPWPSECIGDTLDMQAWIRPLNDTIERRIDVRTVPRRTTAGRIIQITLAPNEEVTDPSNTGTPQQKRADDMGVLVRGTR